MSGDADHSHQQPLFQIRRMFAEGTAEPFFARLWVGIFELREQAINIQFHADRERRRNEFDELYRPVLTALQDCREAGREVIALLAEHRVKLASGSIVQFQPNFVTYTENIDQPLHKAVSRLLVSGVIAMDRSQDVAAFFGLDMGSFFAQPSNFERGMQELCAQGRSDFAKYLRDARAVWAAAFRSQRVAFEHEGWTLPEVRYTVMRDGAVELQEPTVGSLSVSRFSVLSVSRLLAFVETIIVYAVKTVLAGSPFASFATIVEIPTDQRASEMPKRFAYLPPNAPYPEWMPQYRDDDFPLDVDPRGPRGK